MMNDSNYWVGTYVSPSSPDRSTLHQASKDFDIDLSGSTDWNPEIEVTVARNDKLSIQVPKGWLHYLNLYVAIGGLPAPINAFLATNNMKAVSEEYKGILKEYRDDMVKVAVNLINGDNKRSSG